MPGIADQLMERRSKLIAQARDIVQAAINEDRDLSTDEKASVDQRTAEAGELSQRAATFREADQDANDIEESFRDLDRRPRDEKRKAADTLGAWARESRVGDRFDLSARSLGDGIEARAFSATGGTGPKDVSSKLWEYAVSTSQILMAGCEVINTTDGNTLPLPRATVHSTTPDAAVAASGAIAESDPTVTTVNLTVEKFPYIVKVPSELLSDANWDVEGYLARSAGRELGRRIQKQASIAAVAGFTTAGATGPTGTSTTFGTQSTAGQGSDLLVNLLHSVAVEYRAMGAAWLMNDTTAGILENLKSSTGDLIWQPSLTEGVDGRIRNRNVYIDPFLPSPAANAKTVYFGAWEALKVRIAGGLRFERSDQAYFGNDQIGFRAIVRTGAVVIDPNAVKHFAHSAT